MHHEGVANLARFDGVDDLTAHDLRERGSLKWTAFGGGVIGAFVAEMDVGTAHAVTQALREAVGRGEFGYLPPRRIDALRHACARWQKERYGWAVAPERVFPVSGVLAALEVTMRHFSRPDRPVIVPTPAYPPFLTLPAQHGRKVIQVPMVRDGGRYTLDLDGIDRAYRAGADLLVLCNPANPVGRVFDVDDLTAVTEVVDRHGGHVFADEIHAPLTYQPRRHTPYAATSPTAAGHAVTAVSASKAWNLSGLACAQVITPLEDGFAWQRVAGSPPTTASTLGAIASTAAYRAGGAWLDDLLAYLDRNRRALADLLTTHLPEVEYEPPEGTYLAWLDCRRLGIESPLADFFREEAGVAMLDGDACGEAGHGFVRLTFATPLPILHRAVTRMAHAYHREVSSRRTR